MKTLAEEKHLEVTLADEARSGVEEQVRSGFLDWLHQFSLTGEDGVLHVKAHVANATTWGVTFQVPDNPVATLMFDHVEGEWLHADGTL